MAHQITFAQLIAKVQDRTITPDEVRRYFVLDATPFVRPKTQSTSPSTGA